MRDYKWVALSNTTMAVFMSALDGSIVIIALPAIFRGIHLDPLAPGNIGYLLWMIMGYRLVQAVLVVTVGRLGDMHGRVRIYNAGFVVFAAASVLLSFDPFQGSRGAQWLIAWRMLQALGGSMLTANSAAILTDAFPVDQRGLALGINQVAAIAGQFIGLVAGGVLATLDWRAVFWVNVPVGVRADVSARPVSHPRARRRQRRGPDCRAARGGLQFMLIIWLQGIWLPLHGYDYTETPLWAGIYLLPMTAAFLITGPVSGFLSDRFGARGFATAGMLLFGASFIGLMLLPVKFPYWAFAALITVNGIGVGMFSAPNSASIMSSVPARQRGAASGMRSTFQNTGTALSIGVFFSLMIAGLASRLPAALTGGLEQEGVPHVIAHRVATLPPVSSLFAAVLGENPVEHLLKPTGALSAIPSAHQRILTGRQFFPRLIAAPFQHGLVVVFSVAAGLSVLAALASLARGGRAVVNVDSGAHSSPSRTLGKRASPSEDS
jgi:MFS family permease